MINSESWKRFTVKGSSEVETQLHSMALTVAEKFAPLQTNGEIRSLILLGGYGRGEGGVVLENGVEKPHNNFDLLLVSSGKQNIETDTMIKELEDELNFGLDLSIISENKLLSQSPRVIWYDMIKGHKILIGDENYLQKMPSISINDIPSWDFRNLMINRGSLLIINDLLLNELEETPKIRKTVIKHTVKAIIGYGDALLYFNGKYDWSYVKKLENMKELGGVRENFRSLYKQASEFRFKSDYSVYDEKDLKEWCEDLKPILEHVFLQVEESRLKHSLKWDNYLEAFYSAEFREAQGIKDWLKKIRNILKNKVTCYDDNQTLGAKLGVKAGGRAALCSAFFPVAAFNIQNERYRKFFKEIISDETNVAGKYLNLWSQVADKSLPKTLQKFGIELEKYK